MFKTKVTLLFVLFISMASLCWSAGNSPECYPKHFQNEGILQDIKQSELIINATAYELVDNVIVHSLNTQYGSMNNLHKNMDIAFMLADGKLISEIWVLPKGYVELD